MNRSPPPETPVALESLQKYATKMSAFNPVKSGFFSISTCIVVCFVLSTSGCLKTRSQLRENSDESEESKSVPVQPVQDVHPQGQYLFDELKEEMTRMEGRLEDLERTQKELAAKSNSADKEELKKLDARVLQLEEAQANLLEMFRKTEENAALKDPNELFKKAKSQFASKDYEGAAETLGSYLKLPKAKLLQDATFLRGECFYKLSQYKKAIIEYSKFPEKFTKSAHMSEALYKIGLSFEALGMKEDAKGFYQELVEKYPKSSEAKKVHKKVR